MATVTNLGALDPLALPALPLSERKALPPCAAVYFVLAADDAVLYIGRSISLANRWLAHHRLHHIESISSCRIAWLAVSDARLLPSIEKACIERFLPSLNRTEVVRDGTNPDLLNEVFTLRVTESLYNAIVRAARKDRRKPADWIRVTIEEALGNGKHGHDDG